MANTLRVTVNWLEKDNINFSAVADSGHEVNIDPAQVIGSKPMELILMGLGSCASYDVISILQKSRQVINDVQCQITAQRADAIPAVFTDIHLHFVVKGSNVKETQVKKAIELSAEKYCSASRMLANGGVNITHDYTIIITE